MSDELLKETIDRFWETIPPVWNKVRNNTRTNAVTDFGLTLIQFHLLRHIYHGIQTVGDLSEKQQISPPAVSSVVDQLVKKGLVSRVEDKQDRRYVCLTLTEAGSELLTQVFGKNRAWMAEKLKALDPEELDLINKAMILLKNTFDPSKDFTH
jgi:MarR family transcriptional regulator, 2-MHQ and catechol-resistance regulon repressor